MAGLIDRLIRKVVRWESAAHEWYRRKVRRLRAARRVIRLHVAVVWWGRASIVLAGLTVAAVAGPAQAREALVVAVEDMGRRPGPWVVMMVSAVVCSAALWYSFRVILSRRLPGGKRARRRGLAWMVRHLPRAAGMAPYAALMAGSLMPPAGIAACGPTITAAVILGLLTYRAYVIREPAFEEARVAIRRWSAQLAPRLAMRLAPVVERGQRDRLWTWAGIVGVAAVAAMIAVMYAAHPVGASGHGPIGIVLLGMLAWVCLASVLVNWSDESGWPITATALALPIAWGVLDLNDNHGVRTLPGARAASARIGDDFVRWLEARPGRSRFEADAGGYPVVLVAAEGGGTYAAYHAAMTLSMLERERPGFAEHVYAISGVSGGSVGAAVFAGIVGGGVSGRACVDRSRAVLSEDLLSPVLASAVFPDLAQRFLPVPVGVLDRARALEKSLERAFGVVDGAAAAANAMRESLFSPRATNAARTAPLLLLNTTSVETGRRVVLSPVRWAGTPRKGAVFLDDIAAGLDLRVSTAACLSARFPILTPAGTLSAGRETSRLVDGGYYENTGSATLAELIEALPEPTDELRYRLIVIQIRAMGSGGRRPGGRLGEVLSPVRAMLRTRGARGVESVARLKEIAGRERGMYVEFVLRLDQAGPPLGWLLSKDSRLRIERSVRSSAARPAGVGGTNRDAFEGVIAALR